MTKKERRELTALEQRCQYCDSPALSRCWWCGAPICDDHRIPACRGSAAVWPTSTTWWKSKGRQRKGRCLE